MQADEAVDVAFADVDGTGYESDTAELFMDDGNGPDVGAEAEDEMVMALTTAGVTVEKAKICAASMCKRFPTMTFIEIYGRSIRHQSLLTRRNLNVEGLDAIDLRTTKPNGQPWDFCKREDRKLGRQMVDEQQPE